MNIEKQINNEISTFSGIKEAARLQYSLQNNAKNDVPKDYHIIFFLIKNIHSAGESQTATVENWEIQAFYEAVQNFKMSVEKFSNNNVNIVVTTREIEETIQVGSNHVIYYDSIKGILKKNCTFGLYDAAIFATTENGLDAGITSVGMFQFEHIMHGISHVVISYQDEGRLGHSYDYPYLTTTCIMIHEWLHQLHALKVSLGNASSGDIDFPPVHSTNQYSWNQNYFANTQTYPNMVERDNNSYYRAILAADVTRVSNGKKVGMYPFFWDFVPTRAVIGYYLLKNTSGNYYNLGHNPTSLDNSEKFIWAIIQSPKTNTIQIKAVVYSYDSGADVPYVVELPDSIGQYIRVGPYYDGEYIIYNKTLNKVLGYTVSGSTVELSMQDYTSTNNQTFKLDYKNAHTSNLEMGYYNVSPKSYSSKLLRLSSNSDSDGNNAILGVTTNELLKEWQFRRITDVNYRIYPLKSASRSLSYVSDLFKIYATTNQQNWSLIQKNNGKFIPEGKYRIMRGSKYLAPNGTTGLKLGTTAYDWFLVAESDNYYSIYARINGVNYYLDVKDALDVQNCLVQIRTGTGNIYAQQWKFLLQNDDTFIIVPRRSLTRGLKWDETTTTTCLSTQFSSWKLKPYPNP